MNVACNWLRMLTRKTENWLSEFNQPQGSWEIDQVCQTTNVFDLGNKFFNLGKTYESTQNFLGILGGEFENAQTGSEFANYSVQDWSSLSENRTVLNQYDRGWGRSVWGFAPSVTWIALSVYVAKQPDSISIVIHILKSLSFSVSVVFCLYKYWSGHRTWHILPLTLLSTSILSEENTLQDLGVLPVCTDDSLVCVL